MNDLIEELRSYGLKSVTVENACEGFSVDDDFGSTFMPKSPTYSVEFDLDHEGLERLHNALTYTPYDPEEEVRRELKLMHEVNECEGRTVHERIDNYFEMMNNKTEPARYKIRHR